MMGKRQEASQPGFPLATMVSYGAIIDRSMLVVFANTRAKIVRVRGLSQVWQGSWEWVVRSKIGWLCSL
jgi:hypothetical protein